MMRPSPAPIRPGARVLVTGGSSGIGLATARLLAAKGCAVTIVGSNPDRVTAAADSLRPPTPGPTPGRLPGDAPWRVARQSTPEVEVGAGGIVCDFADPAAVTDLAARLAAGPAFDLVIHSAGVGLRAPATASTPGALDRLLAINLGAAVTLTAALLPAMLQRGTGALAYVGSIAGAVGAAGEADYAASKAALAAYAASLRVEIAGRGVAVTVLVPGVVDTDFFRRRGVAYHRPRPKPVAVERAARALVRGITSGRDLVTVPGWLRVPIALSAVAPQWYGRLAARWGR